MSMPGLHMHPHTGVRTVLGTMTHDRKVSIVKAIVLCTTRLCL